MSILENAGYEHYEISNYARPVFRQFTIAPIGQGEDYRGIGPSAFSTVGMQRWQNLADYALCRSRSFRPITAWIERKSD